MKRVAVPLFLLLMPTAGIAESVRIGPSFACPRPVAADRLSQLICDNADMSREELSLAQSYQALRHFYGPGEWKALRTQAATFDKKLRAVCDVPAARARRRALPPGVPACYIAQTETYRSIWLGQMSGSAREEASRPVEQAIALQQRLVALGFLAAGTEPDGVYGEATRAAIVTWQRVAHRADTTGFMSDADAVALRNPIIQTQKFQTATTVVACSDHRIDGSDTLAPDRSDRRCFEALPAQRWEKVAEQRGLLLLRRVPAVVGEPPLYFRPTDVTTVADPRPLAPIPLPRQETSRPRQPDQAATGSSGIGRFAVVILVIAGMLLGLIAVRRLHGARARRRRVRKAFELAMKEVATHQRTLQIRKLQLVGVDAYGTIDLAKWNKERAYFYKTRIMPLLAANALDDQWALINEEVEHRLELAASASASARTDAPRERFVSDPRHFDPRMDPADYERHCAMLLRAAGWKAQVTAASGDQGTDVLARRGGRTLVLQCKLYSNPVGNSAVQEISAARLHQRADLAAVVSNASFTQAARQLARTNGIYLIHHEELRAFDPS